MAKSNEVLDSSTVGILHTFASHQRLKVKLDACGDPIIPGRHGEIGEYGDGRFIACFYGMGPAPFSRVRASRIRRTLALGVAELMSGSEGNDEATFVFDDANSRASEWFIEALGIRRRRIVSPETTARLRQLAKVRQTSTGEAPQAHKTAEEVPMAFRVGEKETSG